MNIRVYVCCITYLFLCVCLFYVCMNIYIYVCCIYLYGWMYTCMLYVCMYVCMNMYMYVCLYVCIYVCNIMYVRLFLITSFLFHVSDHPLSTYHYFSPHLMITLLPTYLMRECMCECIYLCM